MKLTTFEKVNTSVITRYAVFDGDKFVEDFTVNYLDDQPTLHAAVMKKLDYKEHGAIVQHVDVIRGHLEVTLQIKGVRK